MPPGDVRNCLVALAGRRRLAEVFDYRFEGGTDLRDHTVGNIIIAALADMSGGFCEGVQQAARLLRVTGRVYPSAAESLTLVVRYTDGTVTRGEAALPDATIAAADPRRRWRARSGRTGAARQPRPRRRLPAAPLGTGARRPLPAHPIPQAGLGGNTHTPPPVSIADHAADAAALLDHLGVPRAHIAGHSSGAAVAVQLALDHPETVQTLILLELSLLSVPSGEAFLEQAGPRSRPTQAATTLARWPSSRVP